MRQPGFEPGMSRGLNPPYMPFYYKRIWYPRQDLNLQCTGSEPDASAASATRIFLVRVEGVEPSPRGSMPRILPLYDTLMLKQAVFLLSEETYKQPVSITDLKTE